MHNATSRNVLDPVGRCSGKPKITDIREDPLQNLYEAVKAESKDYKVKAAEEKQIKKELGEYDAVSLITKQEDQMEQFRHNGEANVQ